MARTEQRQRLLTIAEVAERLNVRKRTVDHWRYVGTGPRYIRVEGAVRYRESDVEAWENDNTTVPRGPDAA